MAKQITNWRKKGRTAPSVDYDDPTVDFDSATTPYAGNGETPASVIKMRTSWGNRVKQLTRFIINPASDTNEYAYNSTALYNSTQTYNGIVVGEPRSTAKKPTAWSNA